jgi:peptidoglycan/LPS O-acetylase OafA/YrhL
MQTAGESTETEQVHAGRVESQPDRVRDRVDGIDLLRGLAIFFVLMNHVNMQLVMARVPYLARVPDGLAQALVWNGQHGVQMFFAVSGYLITSNSMRRWGRPEALDVRAFYRLRFARIAPLMILLLAVLSGLHVAGVRQFVVRSEMGGLGRALVAALTFHVNYLEATRGYLPGNWDILWSLSVEEMFYLFFPWAARLLGRRRLLVPLLLVLVAIGPLARLKGINPNPVWREYSYMGGMDAIALGCMTAMVLGRRRLPARAVRLCGWAGAALLVYTVGFSVQAYRWGLGRTGLHMTVVAVGTCLTVAAAVESAWRAPWMLRPLLGMGRRSYEIYLTHMFVVVAGFGLFTRLGSPLRGVPLLFAAVIVLASLLGWLVAVTYSEPMNRWLRATAAGLAGLVGMPPS